MRKIFVIVILFCIVSVSAQQATSSFLRFGIHDGRILAKEYLKPFGEILGSNLNSGWYSSAGIHKLGGFDITVVGTYGMVPSEYEFYDLQQISPSLQNFSFDTESSMSGAPTVAGELMAGYQMPSLIFKKPGNGSVSNPVLPNGADFDMMFSPAIQGTVGLPFNTEVMARFMPPIKYDDYGEAFLYGAGLKHSLWDDLPFLNRIPFFRLSVAGGYTHFSSDIDLDNISDEVVVDNILNVNTDAFMGRLLVGADFPFVSVYGGAGYGYSKTTFDLEGTFDVVDFNDSGPFITSMEDPFSLSYSKSGFDFNAGVRVKLMFLILHADYTFSDYQALTVGVGVHFR